MSRAIDGPGTSAPIRGAEEGGSVMLGSTELAAADLPARGCAAVTIQLRLPYDWALGDIDSEVARQSLADRLTGRTVLCNDYKDWEGNDLVTYKLALEDVSMQDALAAVADVCEAGAGRVGTVELRFEADFVPLTNRGVEPSTECVDWL